MAPDLNSLPPSRSVTSSPVQSRNTPPMQTQFNTQDTPSGRSSMSLAAAATMNAADRSRRSSSSYQQQRGSPQLGRVSSERRRSQVAIQLSLNDPTTPSPGEWSSPERRSSIGHAFSAASPMSLGGRGTIATGDPHHQRQPSLGDIHNELEQEQEAQVNRMLQMIRAQQRQLETLQRAQEGGHTNSANPESTSMSTTAVIVDEATPVSERSFSLSRPSQLSRQSSSAARSPALRPLPGQEAQMNSEYFPPSPIDTARRNSLRDESAYYQAETASLTRENQMLRLRIRELEKQLSDLTAKPPNSPPTSSNLATSSPVEAEQTPLSGQE